MTRLLDGREESRLENEFSQNLRLIMAQLGISGAQLAKALNVDPSLVSRWLKFGCGERKASQHALAVGRYVASRRLSPENRAWLASAVGGREASGVTAQQVALWLCPNADIPADGRDEGMEFDNLLVVRSFRDSLMGSGKPDGGREGAALDVCSGADRIALLVKTELERVEPGSEIYIFLSSEAVSSAVDKRVVEAFRAVTKEKRLSIRMLMQSANNSAMSSRMVSAYMPLLVLGKLTLSVVQGTPQTFTVSMNIIIPGCSAVVVTEAVQKKSAAVATVMREPQMISDMRENFITTAQYARPLMTAYDDSYARNIIETFFEEYGMPGSLDVIKSGMNPMFMTEEQYGAVLKKFGHSGEQYQWRYDEFTRFKEAMDVVLKTSRFREVLSLTMLNEIADTGRCKMPSMYFAEAGVWYLDAEDCVGVLNGYIHYLETCPEFSVVLLEDEGLFMPNSCWHIKNNKHVVIHSWDIENPIMVYSDQLLLIDEFQRHFDHLWGQINVAGMSKRVAAEALEAIRDRCAGHIGAAATAANDGR